LKKPSLMEKFLLACTAYIGVSGTACLICAAIVASSSPRIALCLIGAFLTALTMIYGVVRMCFGYTPTSVTLDLLQRHFPLKRDSRGVINAESDKRAETNGKRGIRRSLEPDPLDIEMLALRQER
jgi:hypothetical protein